jgi:hypothetical protein
MSRYIGQHIGGYRVIEPIGASGDVTSNSLRRGDCPSAPRHPSAGSTRSPRIYGQAQDRVQPRSARRAAKHTCLFDNIRCVYKYNVRHRGNFSNGFGLFTHIIL